MILDLILPESLSNLRFLCDLMTHAHPWTLLKDQDPKKQLCSSYSSVPLTVSKFENLKDVFNTPQASA